MASRSQKQILDLGERAPEFALRDLNGKTHSLIEMLSESAVLLVFYKISCPVCQYTLPFLERLYSFAPGAAIQFWGVSQDDAESTREFMAEYGITFPMLLDEPDAYPASNGFSISHVPSMFLVGQDRTVLWNSEGFSRRDLESLGLRFGTKPFRATEFVPEMRSG